MTFSSLNRSVPLRVLLHLVFWGLSWYILLHVFASSSEIQPTDRIYTCIFLFTILVGAYVNLYFLIPLFLNRRKYLLYAFSLILCIAGSAYLNKVTFDHLIDHVLPGYYFISYFDMKDLLKIFTAFIGITCLIKLSKGYFLLMEASAQLTALEKERSQAELTALRSQVNPHFLFNAMNSIYSLMLQNSGKAQDSILKLSGILRYILYETRNDRVDLKTELEYMKDYIELQKLRAGIQAKFDIRITGDPDNIKITPLIFLPLIENSFKHGIKGETGPTFVNIEWIIERNSVRFIAENNKSPEKEPLSAEHNGIGLQNLKRRLQMIYPGKHRFEISETDGRFRVELKIEFDDEI